MTDSPTLSRSVEDYLKAIYALSSEGTPASTSEIAGSLDVQPASVSGMIKRLAEAGYVEHAPYRGVSLSEEGTREALRIIRRHRILELYLSERLGYSWEDVHAEAERLEHAASDELIERMATALENPSHDPHGAPIPTRAGVVETALLRTLDEIGVGDRAFIREVQDDDPDRLRFMQSRGLLPGVLVHVDARAPFDGPITLRVGGPDEPPQTIGRELASQIRVTSDDRE